MFTSTHGCLRWHVHLNHKDVWIIEKFKVGPRPRFLRAFHAVVCYVFARERGVEMKNWAFLLLISLALAFGCQSKQEPPPPPAQEESADGDSPRQIIKNGSITIELESLDSAHKSVEKLIGDADGYVETSELSDYDTRRMTMSLRVPESNFDSAMSALAGLGEVVSQSVSTKDVTGETVDLAAKLKNQRALEARLNELLQQAQTVSEILEIERELARVRAEIDSLDGRAKALNSQVEMSTIHLVLMEEKPGGFGQVTSAFEDGAEITAFVTGGLIRAGFALFPLLVGLGVLLGVWRFFSSRKSK